MTFLNSALLAALTLGLVPVLIHLLNRQRFKTVEFPTLRFLHELQRQKMRQVKVKQMLLLILRTLAVLLLVLAVARPVMRSTAGILPGAEARTTAIIVLDRSASMLTDGPEGSRFRSVQTQAQEILALLGDGDDAQLIWADKDPVVFPESPTSNVRLLREAVVEARPQEQGGDLVKAIQRARAALGQSQNLHKEVYLLSDFSRGAFPERMPDEALLPDDVRLFVGIANTERLTNVGIVSASVTSRIITPGRPVEVSADVKNSGTTEVQDRIVSVYASGRRVAQTRLSLQPGELKSVRLKFVPESPGHQEGYVALEEADDFSVDNRRYFVLRVPANLRVAVVGTDGPARNLTALALNPTADPGGFVQASIFTPGQFESEEWTEYDAIFLVDAGAFAGDAGSRLRSFVENGKGVYVACGPSTDTRASSSLLSPLGLPVPVELWQSEGAPAKWSRTDLAHPLFEVLFEEKPKDVSPEISRALRTNPNGSAVEVVSFATGIPFMWEAQVGRGRAMLMTSSPDPAWSTLFRSGIFAPMMVSAAAYLSGVGTSGSEYQFLTDESARIVLHDLSSGERFELVGSELQLALLTESAPTGVTVNIPAIKTPRSAELRVGNRVVTAVAFNASPAETELQLLPRESLDPVLGGKLTYLESGKPAERVIMEGRYGKELWKLCLWVALALLIAEMLIGRVGRREATLASA